MASSPTEIDRRLTLIARDTRLVAFVLILCAAGTDVALLGALRRDYWTAAAATLVLLAPGVWYAYIGFTLREAKGPIVKWTMWVAACQLAACVLAFFISVVYDPAYFIGTTVLLFSCPR